jgi:hypothetical protein
VPEYGDAGRSEEAVGPMTTRRIVIRCGLSLAAALWLAWSVPAFAQTANATAPPVLKELAGIPELQSLFDRDSDKTRFVLLLSPT